MKFILTRTHHTHRGRLCWVKQWSPIQRGLALQFSACVCVQYETELDVSSPFTLKIPRVLHTLHVHAH